MLSGSNVSNILASPSNARIFLDNFIQRHSQQLSVHLWNIELVAEIEREVFDISRALLVVHVLD